MHYVQLLYTNRSKLTIHADYEHQSILVCCMYPRHHYRFSSSLSRTTFIASWLLGPRRVTWAGLGWSRSRKYWWYNFCSIALQSKKLTRLRSELLIGEFFCFHELRCAGKQVTRKRWIVTKLRHHILTLEK